MQLVISMAQSQFVPKVQLFDKLSQIISQKDTGFLTILTDTNRSVLLRFSQGRITRLHCRSKEAGEAIQVLAECTMVKFSYATAPEDNLPEMMPARSFLQLIDPGGESASGVDITETTSITNSSASDPVMAQMLELAIEYVGVIAEMIVEEAFDGNNDVGRAIEYIANTIPDESQSEAFREEAQKHFSRIDF